MSLELVMPANHLILCCPLLLLPSIFPSIRVFSSESVLCIRWPEYWSFSFGISLSKEYSGLISFRMDWLDLLAVQGTLKSLLQHHSSKASILWHSAFFVVQLSHPYMTTGKFLIFIIRLQLEAFYILSVFLAFIFISRAVQKPNHDDLTLQLSSKVHRPLIFFPAIPLVLILVLSFLTHYRCGPLASPSFLISPFRCCIQNHAYYYVFPPLSISHLPIICRFPLLFHSLEPIVSSSLLTFSLTKDPYILLTSA